MKTPHSESQPDNGHDFDAMCDLFTSYASTVANWKHAYFGAAYSTRIKAAIADMKFAIAEAEKHPEIGVPQCGMQIGNESQPSTGDLLTRLRAMPSSLNDALRTMEDAAARIAELEGALRRYQDGLHGWRRRAEAAEATLVALNPKVEA